MSGYCRCYVVRLSFRRLHLHFYDFPFHLYRSTRELAGVQLFPFMACVLPDRSTRSSTFAGSGDQMWPAVLPVAEPF